MNNNIQIIVTGATGFIGSAFVEYLVKQNVTVLALGRKEAKELPSFVKEKIAGSIYLQIDMEKINALNNELYKLEINIDPDCTFFNLAWGGVSTLSDLNIAAQINNVTSSINAIETAKKLGCRTFVQVGTMEEAFTYKYLNLNHKTHNQYNRHVIYSVAKIAAKNALKIRAKQLDINFLYVLHSHVMGPYDSKDSFLQITLLKLIKGDELIFSSGNQYFDVISIQDCAMGYYLIFKYGICDSEYWVGSGSPKKLREYVELMYKLYPSGKEMQFGKLPYNDIILEKKDFSIKKLVEHTGFKPKMTYEQTVKELHSFLYKKIKGD